VKKKELYTVKAGQVYSAVPKRKGAHKQFVKVLRLSKRNQPKVTLQLITKSGKKKKTPFGTDTFQSWLTFHEGQWKLPFTYTLKK
jgi:hypothetical protein